MWSFAHQAIATCLVALTLTPKVVVVDGQEGVWLPTQQMTLVLSKLDELEKTKDLSRAQDLVIEKHRMRAATASVAIENLEQTKREQQAKIGDLTALAEKQADEIDNAHAWWNSNVLWLSIGAVGTALIGILAGANKSGGTTIIERGAP